MTTVAYVGGLGRSGSTLLEGILGEFSGTCALGEVVHLWKRGIVDDERCGCGEPFSRCPFWTQVGETAFGGWDEVDVARVLRLKAEVDRTRRIVGQLSSRAAPGADAVEYTEHFTRVYEAARTVSGSATLVDSSKHASTAYLLARAAPIALRVVHMVRDSRGVAYSWAKVVDRPEAAGGTGHQQMARMSPGRTALMWNAHNLAFDALARRGTPLVRVHYEQFAADPIGVVTRLARFLDLDVGEIPRFLTDAGATVGTSHQISGNPMRMAKGPVAVRLDESWRTELPLPARRVVTAVTAPLLARYRYPLRSRTRKV